MAAVAELVAALENSIPGDTVPMQLEAFKSWAELDCPEDEALSRSRSLHAALGTAVRCSAELRVLQAILSAAGAKVLDPLEGDGQSLRAQYPWLLALTGSSDAAAARQLNLGSAEGGTAPTAARTLLYACIERASIASDDAYRRRVGDPHPSVVLHILSLWPGAVKHAGPLGTPLLLAAYHCSFEVTVPIFAVSAGLGELSKQDAAALGSRKFLQRFSETLGTAPGLVMLRAALAHTPNTLAACLGIAKVLQSRCVRSPC
jgi:hypothetical protein